MTTTSSRPLGRETTASTFFPVLGLRSFGLYRRASTSIFYGRLAHWVSRSRTCSTSLRFSVQSFYSLPWPRVSIAERRAYSQGSHLPVSVPFPRWLLG